tara:strand:+ start:432 stop:605 length:174 start_codon:yes stop_codon:yes gene_type:complete
MARVINLENSMDRLTLRVEKLEAFMKESQPANKEEYDVDVDEDGPFVTDAEEEEPKE